VGESAFVDDVRHQLVAEGWLTAVARVNAETVVVRALRGDGRGPSKLLAMVVDDADAAVTTDHVRYLVDGAEESGADAALLTALGTVTDRAHRTAAEAGVAVVSPATLRSDDVRTTVLDVLEGERLVRSEGERQSRDEDEGESPTSEE
jgi:hypothetical protein